jgi:hypothetical protein
MYPAQLTDFETRQKGATKSTVVIDIIEPHLKFASAPIGFFVSGRDDGHQCGDIAHCLLDRVAEIFVALQAAIACQTSTASPSHCATRVERSLLETRYPTLFLTGQRFVVEITIAQKEVMSIFRVSHRSLWW